MKIAFYKDDAYLNKLSYEADGFGSTLDVPRELVARYFAAYKEFFAIQAELRAIEQATNERDERAKAEQRRREIEICYAQRGA